MENEWEAVKKRYNCTKIECPKLPGGKADCGKKPCKEGQHQIILFGDKGNPKREFDHFVGQEDDGQHTSQDGVVDPTRPGTGPIFNNIIDPSAHWVEYWKKGSGEDS